MKLTDRQIANLCDSAEARMSRYGLLEERPGLFNRAEIHESFRQLIAATLHAATQTQVKP